MMILLLNIDDLCASRLTSLLSWSRSSIESGTSNLVILTLCIYNEAVICMSYVSMYAVCMPPSASAGWVWGRRGWTGADVDQLINWLWCYFAMILRRQCMWMKCVPKQSLVRSTMLQMMVLQWKNDDSSIDYYDDSSG